MSRPDRSSLLVAGALCWILAAPLGAKTSAWQTVSGAKFRGEPTEVVGPFALFRTGAATGRHVPLHEFSAEDCRRIQAEIAALPPRAARLADAKGRATFELVGNVQRVARKELVPADLTQAPEPEFLLVLCGSHNDGDGWFMTTNLMPFYRRLQRVYPGLVEAVFLGTRHDVDQQRDIATTSGMPWLVADFRQQRLMSNLAGYIPPEGAAVAFVSRQGVPLAAAKAGDAASLRTFFDQVADLLWLLDRDTVAGWPDRVHYLNATRPTEFTQSRTEPLLVGNPVRVEGLRKYGVKRITARFAVAPDGRVTPTLLSGPDDVPAALAPALTAALARTSVLPAIDHGRPVAGTLDYDLAVPPADAALEADRTWLASTRYPLLPIDDWLVLRPIEVPEQEFKSEVAGETADGTVILSALEVNNSKVSRKAQLNAFNSDWFAAAGADSVRPREGDRQRIDEKTELAWEKVRSRDGLVDMQTGVPKDYVVGYAWTEFTVPAATEAWLGLGSDDGVKIWLNGELVHDSWIRRPSRVDDDVVPLHLKAGANRMLIKIQNMTIDWSFIYRLRLSPAR